MTYDVLARARRSTRRRVTAVLLAAAALTLIAAAGVYLTGPEQPPTTADPASPRGATTTGRVDAASVLPADLTWMPVAGVSLPVSGQSGPRDTSGGLARGFAHDRAGAVLAAVHIVVRVAPQVGASVFDPTLRTQVVGPDAAAMRVQVGQSYADLRDSAQVAYGQPVGGLYATLRGYQLTSFTDAQADVQILTAAEDGRGGTVLAATRVRMSWTGADWALVAPPGGTFDGSVTAITAEAAGAYLPFDAGR